jgi:hypothetical protein
MNLERTVLCNYKYNHKHRAGKIKNKYKFINNNIAVEN